MAESVFIAGLFVIVVKEMAAIARRQGQDEEADSYLKAAAEMQAAANEHGWDGRWFLRAYDAFSNKVGSQACDEGHIYVEPQGLCVMAGIGLKGERVVQALDAVYDRLATEHGIMLHQPPYTRFVTSRPCLIYSAVS